eukprot:09108_6
MLKEHRKKSLVFSARLHGRGKRPPGRAAISPHRSLGMGGDVRVPRCASRHLHYRPLISGREWLWSICCTETIRSQRSIS